MFTLGEEGSPSATNRAGLADLFGQLADLVENRAPEALQRQFQSNPERAAAYDFGPSPARLVLALREDYLAQLEQWKATLPSLMRNRMPLRLLSGPQALEAVVRPGRMEGRDLVSDEVGAQIVRFVAQRPDGTPLEDIEAVPPLVSLLCERLNAARLSAHPSQARSSADLVAAQGADILQRFYDESFADFPDAVREYVEDRMVTIGGHRNPVAREDAVNELAARGVAAPDGALDHLVGSAVAHRRAARRDPARGNHPRRSRAAGGQRPRTRGANVWRRKGSKPSGPSWRRGNGKPAGACDRARLVQWRALLCSFVAALCSAVVCLPADRDCAPSRRFVPSRASLPRRRSSSRDRDPKLALLLAAQGVTVDEAPDTAGALLTVLQGNPFVPPRRVPRDRGWRAWLSTMTVRPCSFEACEWREHEHGSCAIPRSGTAAGRRCGGPAYPTEG